MKEEIIDAPKNYYKIQKCRLDVSWQSINTLVLFIFDSSPFISLTNTDKTDSDIAVAAASMYPDFFAWV
jgi:hypothetical protein